MRSLLAIALLASLAACRVEQGGALILNITAEPELAVDTLTITISAAGRMKQSVHSVTGGKIPPALQFAVQLPPSALGDVSVSVSGGGLTASGTATVRATETGTLSLSLKPTAQSDMLTISPTEIPFGKIATTQKSAATLVTVKNTASIASSTLAVVSSGAEFEITADGCGGMSLPANATCTFRVAFVPAMTGAASGTITVSNASVSLTGEGVTPGALASTDSPFDFGKILSTASATKTFTVRNGGGVDSGNLTTTMIGGGTPEQFSKTADTCSGVALSSNGTCTITIEYKPTTQGSHSAYLEVSSPAAGALTLSWTGQAQAPTLTLNPPSHDFGDVKVGDTSEDFSYTVTNSGVSPVGPLAITATAPFNYRIESSCNGIMLNPGDNCTVVVFFQPSAAGDFPDRTIVIAAPNLPTSFSLLASGTAFSCTDGDGDGYFLDSKDGTYVNGRCSTTGKLDDCSDSDTDNWENCATCLDSDGDGFFVGCNRYITRYSECDATANDAAQFARSEEIGGADTDCDGRIIAVDDLSGVFVAPSPTGSDSNPGTQSAPVATIEHAVALLTARRNAIFLQGGTYSEVIGIGPDRGNRIGLYGGFNASWVRDLAVNETIIEPPTSSTGFTISNRVTRVDGITQKPTNNSWPMEGNTIEGTAILDVYDSKLLSGLTWTRSLNSERSTIARKLYLSGGSASIKDDILDLIQNDTSTTSFGGLFVQSAQVSISTTQIKVLVGASGFGNGIAVGNGFGTNTSLSLDRVDVELTNGGRTSCTAIIQSDGSLHISASRIKNCSADEAVGIFVGGSTSFRLLSSVVDGGSSPDSVSRPSSALVFWNVSKPILDAVVANNLLKTTRTNSSPTTYPWGVVSFNGSSVDSEVKIANNILQFVGSGGVGIQFSSSGTGGFRPLNNAITGVVAPYRQGTSTNGTINSCTGLANCFSPSGNIEAACPVDSTYHLQAASPCKSTGVDATMTPISLPAFVDIDGVARPIGAWDIGPDEVADNF